MKNGFSKNSSLSMRDFVDRTVELLFNISNPPKSDVFSISVNRRDVSSFEHAFGRHSPACRIFY